MRGAIVGRNFIVGEHGTDYKLINYKAHHNYSFACCIHLAAVAIVVSRWQEAYPVAERHVKT